MYKSGDLHIKKEKKKHMKSRSLIQVPHILIVQSQSCLLTEYPIRRLLNLAKAFAFQCESSRKEIACYAGKYPRKSPYVVIVSP